MNGNDIVNTDPVLKININWNQLNTVLSQGSSKASQTVDEIVTHFGIRLIYQNENAVFTQSVERESAEENGLITLEVPPTNNAQLFAVAVQNDDQAELLHLMGTLPSLSIETGQEYEWSVNDFDWINAYWEVHEEFQAEYENGAFAVDMNEGGFELLYRVRNPLDTDNNLSYDELSIRLNGTGVHRDYADGYRNYATQAFNHNPGSESIETFEFFPYLVSDRFNLPSARYRVGDLGTFDVQWTDPNEISPKLSITLDWNFLDQQSENHVSHFGIRLHAKDAESPIIKSFDQDAGTSDKIEFEFDSNTQLDLYLVAVEYGDEHQVRLMSAKRDVTLYNGDRLQWSFGEFDWVLPSWEVAEDYKSDFEDRLFKVDKDQDEFELPYRVLNPFDVTNDINYEELFIKLNGIGIHRSYENGYRNYVYRAKNSDVGTEHTEEYKWYPFLDYRMFDLPDARYIVYDKGDFDVQWQ